MKSCFVIMGFGIKNNINLDLTYCEIIKPCIEENNLKPYSLYNDDKFNAFRCDEIIGTTSIDYKFITCLSNSDIVIADISTMNANAIYELGVRHALKPKSTIILCAKDKEKEFKFFDINYVPIIFYEHSGLTLDEKIITETKTKLNQFIDFAITNTDNLPDNPIHRALIERKLNNKNIPDSINKSLYSCYLDGKKALEDNNFEEAELHFSELYEHDSSEENLLLLSLAKYKIAEKNKSNKSLIECLNFLQNNIDIEKCNSEYLIGRIAAISLRIYNLTGDEKYYYNALNHYRIGSFFCKTNLYCPRNYCATLLRIHELTEDPNIIREYFYTAIHFAKIYQEKPMTALENGGYDERIYYRYNLHDLKSIINGKYINYDKMMQLIEDDKDISALQKSVITYGITKLKDDIDQIQKILKLF